MVDASEQIDRLTQAAAGFAAPPTALATARGVRGDIDSSLGQHREALADAVAVGTAEQRIELQERINRLEGARLTLRRHEANLIELQGRLDFHGRP